METMHQTGTRWLVILGLLSWAAPAAGAQPESGAGNTESLEPAPADLRITDDPTFAPAACSTGGSQQAVAPRRSLSRIKARLQYSYWGYPEEFEEIPFGARVRAHQEAQICSGWSARLWLYRYDFCDDGASLNAAGHKRLSELAHEFPVWSHHDLVIEATPGQPQLDAARRAHVEKQLETLGIPAQVVIGVPTVSAPFGDETRVWNSLLTKQIQSGGPRARGSQGGSSSGGGALGVPAAGQ
jgi:hypothetical protein